VPNEQRSRLVSVLRRHLEHTGRPHQRLPDCTPRYPTVLRAARSSSSSMMKASELRSVRRSPAVRSGSAYTSTCCRAIAG